MPQDFIVFHNSWGYCLPVFHLTNLLECGFASRTCGGASHHNKFHKSSIYAYALLNPYRRETVEQVKRMQEDLEYFSKHAMTNPNLSRNAKPIGGGDRRGY